MLLATATAADTSVSVLCAMQCLCSVGRIINKLERKCLQQIASHPERAEATYALKVLMSEGQRE